MRRRWTRLLVVSLVLLIAGALLPIMLDSFARQMLYPAPPVPVPAAPPPLAEVGLDLATGDRIVAWVSTPAGLKPEAPIVLFFHGNGENLETLRGSGLFEELGGLGVAVLAVDYPGYGRSTGKPTEEGVNASGDAALAWARERHPQRPVVVAGWSLGAAVAISLVSRHPEEVRGLIALSPWTTLAEVASEIFPAFAVKAMLREKYDSRQAARSLRVPALVVHGERDDLIPVEQGREIASTLAGPTRWVEVRGAAHNDLLSHRQVWEEMGKFLRGF